MISRLIKVAAAFSLCPSLCFAGGGEGDTSSRCSSYSSSTEYDPDAEQSLSRMSSDDDTNIDFLKEVIDNLDNTHEKFSQKMMVLDDIKVHMQRLMTHKPQDPVDVRVPGKWMPAIYVSKKKEAGYH